MGRPLKIKKSTTGDIGFNALDSLTNPVYPSTPTTFGGTEYLGVVGGANASVATATYPVVKCRAFITGTLAEDDAYIITQKGSTKYQVATVSAVNDEDMVVGASYMILSLGGTNWQQMGAPAGAVAGTIFTCTAAVASASTGTALLVGTCVLTDSNTPTVGNMSIAMAVGGDSTEVYISKLTNKFAQDFNGGATGGSANTGDVWAASQVVNDIEYAANFFTDESTFAKSGAEVDTWASSMAVITR
jgi:hypothetical protein